MALRCAAVFIGHFAVGFAAKRAAPRLSLAVLFLAVALADVIWPVLVWLGIEQVRIDRGNTRFTPLDFVAYPYSHSLLFLVIWGVILGAVCAAVVHDRKMILIVTGLVVSHWMLDWITHRPDMPLYPGGAKLGLGMWNSIPGTIGVEGILFAAGVWMYAHATRPRDAIGRRAFAVFVAFMAVVYLADIGTPPPSIMALVATAIAGTAVMLLWAWWFDRHRSPVT